MLIVHRHPGPHTPIGRQCARRDLAVAGEEEIGDAPVVGVLFCWPVGTVARAKLRVHDGVARRPVFELVVEEVTLVRVLRLQVAHVQEGEVDCVDVALERLHPVAVAHHRPYLRLGIHVRLEVGQWWWRLAPAHIGPDHAAALDAGVGNRVHLVLKIALLWLAWHVDAGAGAVELPAVVDTAQAVCLVAAVKERGAAVRAGVLEQSHLAGGDAEADEILAQQADAQRRAARRWQLVRAHGRYPVLAHEFAHGSPRAYPTEDIVVFLAQHGFIASISYRLYSTFGLWDRILSLVNVTLPQQCRSLSLPLTPAFFPRERE